MDAVQFLTRLAGEYHEYGLYASATLLRPPLESLSAGQSGPLAGGRQEAIRSIEVSKIGRAHV